MAACTAPLASGTSSHRRRFVVSQSRIDANRCNARHSTGPRTPEGKAKVSRNAVKHCLFASPDRWGETERQDFAETLSELNREYQPVDPAEAQCIESIASSATRLAALLRFESREAAAEHRRREREMEDAIAAAPSEEEAEQLRAHRAMLQQAGLWKPTIPGPRAARVVLRYEGRLNREFYGSLSMLEDLRKHRIVHSKSAKTNPSQAPSRPSSLDVKTQKQTQLVKQNQGFSYERHPTTDGPIASAAADLAAMLGDPTRHLIEADSADRKNAKTNPSQGRSRPSSPDLKTQKQTQLVKQNQGFSYERRPTTDAPIASAVADLAAMLGDPTRHLIEAIEVTSATDKNAKTNPSRGGPLGWRP